MLDREALLDELARCFVQAAVSRLLREQRGVGNGSGGEIGRPDPTPQDNCQSPNRRRAKLLFCGELIRPRV
jgi:hypothetical protein